ncbi:phage tail protein [Streptomyces phaeochromogenes]|uniref:phage tail tube protein n=1 Tax=Streptomyces phaeochromogenes TaxID=1923 RepID=UPI0022536CAF|nr:phage tail protein [Streptomyces phaeochromogenes]MCX5598457.1 phage tail protein [Streptomyces phaeochromogenes]
MVNITRAADLLEVGANGGGWVAPLGSTSPGDPEVQPVSPWLPLGAISDDGLVQGFEEDTQSFTPWGYTAPIRTTITSSLRTFGLTVWEVGRTTVQSLQYRLDVADLAPASGLTSFAETASPVPDRRAFWFVVLDGDTFKRGFYVPEGEITERSDVTHKQDEIAGFEWTITAYPDDAGITVYHFDRVPDTAAYTGS